MNLTKGAQMLDVGACLIAAAKKIGSTGHVIGIDLYENCITEVNSNIEKNKLINASVEIMDARNLTYKDNTFGYITSGFIGFGDVFDFANNKCRKENDKLEHIYCVLKPIGKVGISK